MHHAPTPPTDVAGAAHLLSPTSFADIEGWSEDDLGEAFRAFRTGALQAVRQLPKTRSLGIDAAALQGVAHHALRQPEGLHRSEARRFFETHFRPHRIEAPGFVTAYYEPEVAASRTRREGFNVPLLRRPPDLVEIKDGGPSGWDPAVTFARRTGAALEPYFDRAAIECGALDRQGLELAWIADPVDAFFIHVQGSARLRLVEGGTMRIGYDGKSGHPYTSIGRLAVQRGLLSVGAADKEGLEAWLKADRARACRLMHENRSFIFFRETLLGDEEGPIGAAGVPLSPGRSLAVDRTSMTFHSPVWVDAPDLESIVDDGGTTTEPFRRLMMAQDTGSAIVGPARGDLFFGSGNATGARAGRVRHAARMVVLAPRAAVA